MASRRPSSSRTLTVKPATWPLDRIKRLAVIAMFSDDELLDALVLKGGNAIALVYRLTSRESIDLDFSMHQPLAGGSEALARKINHALERTFRSNGLEVFDFEFEDKPAHVSDDVRGWWGGYGVEFKLLTLADADRIGADLEARRKAALSVGQGTRFKIDISQFEITEGKREAMLDDFVIFAYSPAMIVCEKLRALCQQRVEYSEVVHRGRPGTPRARDFFDIRVLVDQLHIDLMTNENLRLLHDIFDAKRVDVALLDRIELDREFHRSGFETVAATVTPGTSLESFDVYFDSVVDLARRVLAKLQAVG